MSLPKRRITKLSAVILIAVAGGIDALQAFLNGFVIGPIANRVISLFATVFWIFFLVAKGIPIMKSPKRYFSQLVTTIGEIMPISDTIPFWTVNVTFIVVTVMKEDERRITQAKQAQQAEEEELMRRKMLQIQQYRERQQRQMLEEEMGEENRADEEEELVNN